jgi:hypothetical protein
MAVLGSGTYWASNENEYQEQKNYVYGEQSGGRCVGLTTLQLWADYLDDMMSLTSHNVLGPHYLLRC